MKRPCRMCGRPAGEHWSGCPAVTSRRRAAVAASCLGAIVDLQAFEEAQQSAYFASVNIPYDPERQTVTRGIYRGMNVRHAVLMEVTHLSRTWPHITVQEVTLRPWWNWWRPTPARRVAPAICPEDFTVTLR